jgi:hypothetical protein
MHYQHVTTILILTGVWNRAGSTTGNNGGGGVKPYAAPRLCMYWNISAILWSASRSAIILASISWCSLLSSSSWVCNITSQRYSNSKRRYITQGRTSYRSTNLELLYAMLWAVVPRSYGWTRVSLLAPEIEWEWRTSRLPRRQSSTAHVSCLLRPSWAHRGRSARCLDHNLGHGPPAPWQCSHEGGCRRRGWCRPWARHPGCRWRQTSPCPYGP